MMSELRRDKLARLFHLLDADGNGRLEATDLERIADELSAHRGWTPDSDGARAVRHAYDRIWERAQPYVRHSCLELDDFVAYHEALLQEPDGFEDSMGHLSDLTFSSLDADGDGRITLEEHRAFCEIFNFDPILADAIFPMWDADGSGFVSTAELASVVRQFFYSDDETDPGNWLFGPLSSPIEEVKRVRA